MKKVIYENEFREVKDEQVFQKDNLDWNCGESLHPLYPDNDIWYNLSGIGWVKKSATKPYFYKYLTAKNLIIGLVLIYIILSFT